MVTNYQLPALARVAGPVTIAPALTNADQIGEGLTLGVAALISVPLRGTSLRRRLTLLSRGEPTTNP
jgi:hypothetical protein